MASSSAKSLREILFSTPVEKILVDRATETPIIKNRIDFKNIPTFEAAQHFMKILLDEMDPEADEVYPNLHIGNYKGILDIDFLKKKGITHVFNVGEHDPTKTAPKIEPQTFQEAGIQYQTKLISDFMTGTDAEQQIEAFREAAKIVMSILKEPDARLVVNCFGGLSRSTSVVVTYLIEHQNMRAEEALLTVKKNRDVWPNNSNLSFLAKISNAKHGFEDVDDGPLEEISLRSIIQQKK